MRSTERSSNVPLTTCHSCVGEIEKDQRASFFSDKLSVLNPSKLFLVIHRMSSS